MRFLFKNELIEYEISGQKNGELVLFLHGWGMDKTAFSSTVKLLQKKFKTLTLTMPTIQPTVSVWTLFDYANLIEFVLKLNNIESVLIVCHSFGFRVAMILNKKINIKKIIITGGAGIKNEKYFDFFKKINKNNIKILLKHQKQKNLYEKFASSDYKILSPINKKSFKNIINLNLQFSIKFSCPILLFWGTKDTETPLWIARQILKHNDAKLVLTNSNHFAYIEENHLFNNKVLKFLCES